MGSNKRPTVADIRAMKARGQKISMLYVTTLEEAEAANAAGIDMLSIEGRLFSPEMREAAAARPRTTFILPTCSLRTRNIKQGVRWTVEICQIRRIS